MAKILFDYDYIKINRKALFSGSGVINTFAHILCHLAIRNGSELKDSRLKGVLSKTGEYICCVNNLDFLSNNCNGTSTRVPLKKSLKTLSNEK